MKNHFVTNYKNHVINYASNSLRDETSEKFGMNGIPLPTSLGIKCEHIFVIVTK